MCTCDYWGPLLLHFCKSSDRSLQLGSLKTVKNRARVCLLLQRLSLTFRRDTSNDRTIGTGKFSSPMAVGLRIFIDNFRFSSCRPVVESPSIPNTNLKLEISMTWSVVLLRIRKMFAFECQVTKAFHNFFIRLRTNTTNLFEKEPGRNESCLQRKTLKVPRSLT